MAKETKKQRIAREVAEAVGAGKELHLESVDFSDPNRPKTCLEVDFPILPINQVAAIEGNAGKPIYQMSKWWARRRSSVFRAMLIAAATKAPDDPAEAAKLVWDSYYGNHQKNEAFKKLKVADIFMGGGTTIVEGSRLGMQMFGNDLNPVAWFIVKNEMAQVDPDEVQKLLDAIEAEVKPQIMPFYACDCPRGHKGKWTRKSSGQVMGDDFDPLALAPEERADYDYEGPEVIYTFWAKHGPCQATECNHRTPIMTTPVVAVKTLTVKAWRDRECGGCGKTFDVEQKEARMAPGAMLVDADTEPPYAVMDADGRYACPHCGKAFQDEAGALSGDSGAIGKAKNKKIDLTLLVHPDWLKGSPGVDEEGRPFGGSVTDDAESTARWNAERAKTLKLIEVRGKLPEKVVCPDTKEEFFTDKRGGTIPRQKQFTCKMSTCGLDQDILIAVEKSNQSPAFAAYCVQGTCPECDAEGIPYGGRFFGIPLLPLIDISAWEWDSRFDAFAKYVPDEVIPNGYMTPVQNDLPGHGFSHWRMMFNSRQLYVLSLLLSALERATAHSPVYRSFILGAFQQYLRNQNMFCIWDVSRDCLAPFFSNANYHPKPNVVENSVFSSLGRGNWASCSAALMKALEWKEEPWELLPKAELIRSQSAFADDIVGKSLRVHTLDPPVDSAEIQCQSSTELSQVGDASFDLVITDPPFDRLIQYSELADYFFVWLRRSLRTSFGDVFSGTETPKSLEAVTNRIRNVDDPKGFYRRLLTECWKEASRILGPSGILAFTFHHSEDEPWVAVLESLFDSGFYLEAAFPIRSDESKGNGQFGSKQIEFDIIHVCRKRLEDPESISWAKLRRRIVDDVRQLRDILEQHQEAGLSEADLQVIRRGKALEHFSRHYGKVYIEKGREEPFTVRDALAGINSLLDDESDTSGEAPPVDAEPYTRLFLRLFADKTSLTRDEIQKFLRGTGVTPSEFLDRKWCAEQKKVFTLTPALDWAQTWKGEPRRGMARDFDQAWFLIGACFDDSGIRMSDTLDAPHFKPHAATGDLLAWFIKHAGDETTRDAARRAKRIYDSWLAKRSETAAEQGMLFDKEAD